MEAAPHGAGLVMARRGRIWRCRCGKWAFSNRRLANKMLARLSEPGYVYWCRCGGAYHVTTQSPEEYAHRRSTWAVA